MTIGKIRKHIYLSGFMGSGKTVVGRLLAQNLSVPFCDTDSLIEKKAGKTIREIFKTEGEPFFRNEERKILRSTRLLSPRVVAVGGGAVLSDQNRCLLREGYWVNLRASLPSLMRRLKTAANRPLLPVKNRRDQMERLLKSREPFYNLAPLQVETDGLSPDSVAEEILRLIQKKNQAIKKKR